MILLLSAFVVILCCIGAVSAVDDADDIVDAVNDDIIEDNSLEDTLQYSNDEVAVENNTLSVTLKTEENKMDSDSINSPISWNNGLSVCDNENMILSDSANINHVYVSPDGNGNGTLNNQSSFEYAIENIQDNTIIHMADGCYNLNSTLSISSKQNITIQADNPDEVFITGGNASLDYLFKLNEVVNVKFKYIIVMNTIHKKGFLYVSSTNNIKTSKLSFEECTFVNCTGGDLINSNFMEGFSIECCNFLNNNLTTILYAPVDGDWEWSYYRSNPRGIGSNIVDCTFENNALKNCILFIGAAYGWNIDECKFINNSFDKFDIFITSLGGNNPGFHGSSEPAGLINISNCMFNDAKINLPAVYVERITSDGMAFDNNIVESNYAIEFAVSSLFFGSFMTLNQKELPTELHSVTYLNVLNNRTVVVPEDKINITAVLVDGMGNAIKISNLKLIVNNTVCPTKFIDGIYYAEYTVPNYTSLLDIDVNYKTIIRGDEFSHIDSEMCTVTQGSLLVKPAINFILDEINGVYGENVTVHVDLPDVESGNLTYLVMSNGKIIKNITHSFKGNVSDASFENLATGNYDLKITFGGNDEFGPSKIIHTFVVDKANPDIQLIAEKFVSIGDKINVQAVLPADANGYVNFAFNGINRNVAVVDGVAKTKFNGLTQEGNYMVFVNYYGDNNYNPVETSLTIKNKVNSSLNLSYSPPIASEDVIVTIKMDEEINDNVTVTVNGKSENMTLVNGTTTVVLPKVSVNEIYTISVNYEGKGKFKDASNSTTFKVYKLDTNISTSVKPVKLGEAAEITINVDLNATGIISVGNKYSVVIKKGSAFVRIPGLGIGNYTYSVVYYGDGRFNGNQTTVTFSVKIDCSNETTVSGITDLTTAGNIIGISLPVDAEGFFTVVVDGNPVRVGVVNGSASIPVSGWDGGKHNITLIYSGDARYAGYCTSQIVEVAKLTPKMTLSHPSKVTAGKSSTIKINLPSDATGHVLIEVQGKKYDNIKVVNGVAAVNIAGLKAGNPVLKYTYKGNAKYSSVSGSVKLKVVGPKVTVTLKKVKVKKSAKKLVLQSTVKIDGKTKKGLKVTFKFNGKKIGKAKTTAKGVAKITIKKSVLKKLKVGKKLTYSATYGKVSDKKTVKIKK